ncbi:hypothetical protein GJ496_004188 [Pomphorhynchus laevis]|nr:hypothetical protein GJ496_004188 [Pomphorhynchus laevis]
MLALHFKEVLTITDGHSSKTGCAKFLIIGRARQDFVPLCIFVRRYMLSARGLLTLSLLNMDKCDNPVIVCDNGTGFMKCGFAGRNFPDLVFPSIFGTPMMRWKTNIGQTLGYNPDLLIGDDANLHRQTLNIHYPMENGIVQDWNGMSTLYNYAFDKLKVDPRDSKILLTEAPLNPLKNRQRMIEMMLEEFGFRGCYVAVQAVLTLYSQGVSSGVVVDSGDGVTHICPVYEGFCLSHLTRRLDIAGRSITRFLIKLLCLHGYAFNHSADFETARMIKEKFCYVAYDLDQEQKLAQETTVLTKRYQLSDGREIKLGTERFEAAEVLFQPRLNDVESVGIGELLYKTIQDAPIDIRQKLMQTIVLSGGTTMLPGLPTRLEKELKQLFVERTLKGDIQRLSKFRIGIEDPPGRKHMVFIGGSMLANVMRNRGNEFWVTKEDYEENGINYCCKKLSELSGSDCI